MKSLLVEIGCEEIPARMVAGAVEQLEERIENWIKEKNLDSDFPDSESELQVMATPRRLVIRGRLPEKEEDKTTRLKGPPAHVAYDGEEPTGALEGFCRQNDIDPKEVEVKKIDGGEYVTADKVIRGRGLIEAVRADFPEIILSLDWPKQMRWEESGVRFIRPLRWILVLADDAPFDFQIGPVASSPESRGLRLGENERFSVNSLENYRDKLQEDKIILDLQRRKKLIAEDAKKEAKKVSGRVVFPEGLLMEVTNLVEAPVVFSAEFSEEFLDLPRPVLTETMVAHQKYFPVEDEQTGDLKACFIGVRNGGEAGLETVIKGNERVIRARLNDAVFFYNKDLEREFESYREDLEGVIFQEELGSLYNKTERLAHLADKLEEVPGQLVEIARHCKNDQVTEIVDEFPSLQGTMGAIYAKNSGWPEESARVIEEHYYPRDRDDELPSTSPGRWLSLLDRVDTLVGFFNLGSRPTGSADPYGLRRDAISLLRVITGGGLEIDLEKLIEQAAHQYESAGIEVSKEALDELEEFIVDRFYYWYRSEEGWSDELVGAVLDRFWSRPLLLEQRLEWLAEWKKSEDFIAVVEAARRIYNIAGKQSRDDINSNLFEKSIEEELLKIAKKSEKNIDEALASEAPERVLGELENLSSVVHEYFEEVMVMADDQEIKNNRLATLTRVHEVYDRIANFSNFEV